ncbi:hypothetical protein S21ZY_138 [Pseudomonas phage ZY21]|nr:hypothetical protein S21ZY_138 [Pseudomonas phage ZY21]
MKTDTSVTRTSQHSWGMTEMPMTSDHHWESLDPVEKERQRQLMHRAGIKGRYQYLNLEWTEEILEEAVKRDGGGITVYLHRIATEQTEARRARLAEWGIW